MRWPLWSACRLAWARVQLSLRMASFFATAASRSALALSACSAFSLSRAFFFLSRAESMPEAGADDASTLGESACAAPAPGPLMMFFAGVPGGGAVSLMCS